MNIDIKIAKLAISLRDSPIVSNSNSSLFHCFANLNILSNLKPLKTVKILPLVTFSSWIKIFDKIISIRLAITIMQSNEFIHDPFKKFLKPNAVNFTDISNKNIREKAMLSFSSINVL